MLHSLLVQQPQYECVCACVRLGDSAVCSAHCLITSSHGALDSLTHKDTHTVHPQADVHTQIKSVLTVAVSVFVCMCQ